MGALIFAGLSHSVVIEKPHSVTKRLILLVHVAVGQQDCGVHGVDELPCWIALAEGLEFRSWA